MERFVKGEVVVLNFPFTDLSSSKKRPALVVATLRGDNIILCQITSQNKENEDVVFLKVSDFENGKLSINSWIVPSMLFTANYSIINYKVGKINSNKIREVQNKICEIFTK